MDPFAGPSIAPPRPIGEPRPLATEDEHQGPPFEKPKPPWLKRTVGPILATIAAFFAKFKALIVLLPKIKVISTAGTMFVSLAAYAWLWGWPFAAGFIVLLFVHEMGHVIQLRREGIKASAPMFVPFLGALISAKSLGDNATAEARVGLAGPIVGTLGAAACIVIWHGTGNDLWRALAFTGFFLNLFNLVPLSPLDGGRAMAAMAPWMWLVGLALMIGVLIVFPNPLILLFLVIGGMDSWRRYKQRGERPAYYRVRPLDRLLVAAVYLSLIAVLVAGMQATNLPRTFN